MCGLSWITCLPADFGVSAKNTKTLQRRDSFIGTPYWWVEYTTKNVCHRHHFGKSCTYVYYYAQLVWTNYLSFIETKGSISVHYKSPSFLTDMAFFPGWLQRWWCARRPKIVHMTSRQTSGLWGSPWLSWRRLSPRTMRWTPWESCWK